MLDAHYSYSKSLRTVLTALTLAVVVSGCSTTTKGTSTLALKAPSFEANDDTKASVQSPTAARAPKSAAIDFGTTASVGKNLDADSASCRFLKHTAEAEATIIESATLEANSDEEGSGSVSLAMNLFDFKKAELVRSSAEAKCRYHAASKRIEATLGLAGEATKFARNWAKYEYINSQMSVMNRIQKSANVKTNSGFLTRQDANAIKTAISQLKSDMELARAEANKSKDLPAFNNEEVKNRHAELLRAAEDIQDVEREIRTNDGLELNVSAGYRYNESASGLTSNQFADDAFAKVTLGVRLGIFSPKREAAERAAAEARAQAMFEQNTGALWKSDFTKRSVDRMVRDLKRSEAETVKALANANNTISNLKGVETTDAARALITAQIQRIKIGARLAEIKAAIRQLQENSRKIASLSGD